MQSPQKPISAHTPTMALGDIYYILFRHKWKIITCAFIGLIGSAAFYHYSPAPYSSEAKLYIRYVVTESKTPTPGDDTRLKSPDSRGETIMDSEREILTSLDLSKQVAEAVGPERILAKAGGGKDLNRAAMIVNHGLMVDAPRRSSVIDIVYSHPDVEIVQPVLNEIVRQYLKMHVEIHRAAGIMNDALVQEADQLRNRLAQTEEELRKVLAKAGVVSLDEAKTSIASELNKLQAELYASEAEFAERSSILTELTKGAADAPANASEQPVPVAKVNEYRGVAARIELLRRREQEMLSQFTPESSRVKELQAQIEEANSAKQKLEQEFPTLVRTNPIPSTTGHGAFDVAAETAKLNAMRTRIKVINAQMDDLRKQVTKLDQLEGSIMELKRRKDLEESNYRYIATAVEQARINEALGAGKVSNISQVQTPSPPFVDNKKPKKIASGIAVGGLALGLAWAFLIELYFDRSVRRPVDVERMSSVPLFLTIPSIGKPRKTPRLSANGKLLELEAGRTNNGLVPAKDTAPRPDLASGPNSIILNTFHETLRDRLISYFESVNMTHKPKLVAVTGLGRGSGVTTTAAGLARSLSETGEGNVLLVDMTAGQGSAQQFYRGKDIVGLEEILSTRDDAKVEDKLYVVAEEPGKEKLSRILPQRFTKIVPKLKASNFDYIIFDMPPVNQISITPRLAGFMDMVLLVIESEKTNREVVERATSLLAQSNAHVGAVLNKAKNYVPSVLHQDYLGNG
jgi:uncharacterized protein involved in exopolysaccharide biosynthesis/Mrp family chromosome partitioning ATPase